MACMFVDTYVDTRNMAGIQTTYCRSVAQGHTMPILTTH